MGVNMAGNCIINDEVCREASCQEIIRRYYNCLCDLKRGNSTPSVLYKLELLMKQAGITVADRRVIAAAMEREAATGAPAAAIELPDGTLVTGKTTSLLGASSACLLNSLKILAGIDHELHLVSPEAIRPIQSLKTDYLGSQNPRLHTDEILIALSISAATDENAARALAAIPLLKGDVYKRQVHIFPVLLPAHIVLAGGGALPDVIIQAGAFQPAVAGQHPIAGAQLKQLV